MYAPCTGRTLTAIEVKSGRARDAQPGLAAFAKPYRPRRKLLVGGDGISLEEFLSRPVEHWVRRTREDPAGMGAL